MATLYGSSGDPAEDVAAQEMLIEGSLPQLFEEYEYARERSVVDPVVFLVDCEDEIGAPMARAWEGNEAVDAAILDNLSIGMDALEEADIPLDSNDSRQRRIITTLARAFSFDECRREVPEFFPYLAPSFESTPPTGGFLAVVVTAGGAATFTVPFSARP